MLVDYLLWLCNGVLLFIFLFFRNGWSKVDVMFKPYCIFIPWLLIKTWYFHSRLATYYDYVVIQVLKYMSLTYETIYPTWEVLFFVSLYAWNVMWSNLNSNCTSLTYEGRRDLRIMFRYSTLLLAKYAYILQTSIQFIWVMIKEKDFWWAIRKIAENITKVKT